MQLSKIQREKAMLSTRKICLKFGLGSCLQEFKLIKDLLSPQVYFWILWITDGVCNQSGLKSGVSW